MRTIEQIAADVEAVETEWARAVNDHDAAACADCERRHEALIDELWRAGGIGE
ncbi:hypothetical protein [Methylosinus sp. Sm6]|uniref:hypothetical protein n=1 Tax=Methylosinus sp. Sm6 TaxID=2866948 RepID=UPI001C98EE1A|nr:hypothetical protein [Methylosinus sp. Sm6]MBY6244170.1 hypothetical protein [Methylosinus sp. Sm6]